MCKELKLMAGAEESLITPAALMGHNAEGVAATSAALDLNAGGAAPAPAAASDYILQGLSSSTSHGQWESKLLHMQINLPGNGSVGVINRDINPSLIPINDVDHSSPLIHGVLHRPLPLPVLAHDHDHELVVQKDVDHAEQISGISMAQMQSAPSRKLHARCKPEKEEEEEGDQEEEEEGCATPTARDQRIPQYNEELNTSGLVCPPAPKKKPCASKRRRLFYSADDGAANYHIVAERRAFLVDPPDLHNFPDCIRALFK